MFCRFSNTLLNVSTLAKKIESKQEKEIYEILETKQLENDSRLQY